MSMLYVNPNPLPLHDPLGFGLPPPPQSNSTQRRFDANKRPVKKRRDDNNNQRRSPTVSPDLPVVVEDHNDDYIDCPACGEYVYGLCKVHGWNHIKDKTEEQPDKVGGALGTLPDCCEVSESPIHGLGVFATSNIPKNSVFGPYRGTLAPLEDQKVANNGYAWEIRMGVKHAGHYVNAIDPKTSNWLRYVNSARYGREQNLCAFQWRAQVYYRVTKEIPVGNELLVWYGEKYGAELGLVEK